MFDGYEIPSPGLAATLSPSDGERAGVRGGSADLVSDILLQYALTPRIAS